MIFLRPPRPQSETLAFTCVPGLTLELCVAQFWTVMAASHIDIDITFHAIAPDSVDVAFDQAAGAHRVNVRSSLRACEPLKYAVSCCRRCCQHQSDAQSIHPHHIMNLRLSVKLFRKCVCCALC